MLYYRRETITHHIERFDKLLVHGPRLRERVAAVFVKDGGERPLLDLAKTADEAARAVLLIRRRGQQCSNSEERYAKQRGCKKRKLTLPLLQWMSIG